MREEDEREEPNWFSRWEEELPSPEELTPLSQTLITPDLALAFDIPTTRTSHSTTIPSHRQDDPSLPPAARHHTPLQPDFELPEPRGCAAPEDEPARTLKRPRLVWTPQLHKRFVDAVAQLGIKNAVPKTIMQLMNVEGLTRENVASHLQKYRLYLKRVQQGLSPGAGAGPISSADAAADYLFASAPVPHHFLGGHGPRGGVCSGGAPDQFMPFRSAAPLQQHHHQRMAAVAAAAHPQQQQYYYPPGHMGHLAMQQKQPGIERIVGHALDLDPDAEEEGGERKVLTLFPTGDH